MNAPETALTASGTHEAQIEALIAQIESVFVGKRAIVERVVTALICGGHVLLEDVPGMGKTTLAKALARALNLPFRRIQFTSDMLPSDVLGTHVYEPNSGSFRFRSGPVFSNIVLADELNRTSPRTQSALLEAMNEDQVSVENETFPLPDPFFVIATQNPKELYGTYPLPESQLDRFLFSLTLGYASAETEKQVIAGHNDENRLHLVKSVLSQEQVLELRRQTDAVQASEAVVDYVYQIVAATRESPVFELGISPRAGIQLLKAARGTALIRGRRFVTPDDVRTVAPQVLAHRLALRNADQVGGARDQVLAHIEELLDALPLA